jgi:hypothetical protein
MPLAVKVDHVCQILNTVYVLPVAFKVLEVHRMTFVDEVIDKIIQGSFLNQLGA